MVRKVSLVLLVLLYVGAGVNHFIHPAFYASIMPPYIPFHRLLVALSSVAEVVLGLGLCFTKTRKQAAGMIAIMLVLFIPVHIFMLDQAYHVSGYRTSVRAAWVRLLLQPVLILWVLWHRREGVTAS